MPWNTSSAICPSIRLKRQLDVCNPGLPEPFFWSHDWYTSLPRNVSRYGATIWATGFTDPIVQSQYRGWRLSFSASGSLPWGQIPTNTRILKRAGRG